MSERLYNSDPSGREEVTTSPEEVHSFALLGSGLAGGLLLRSIYSVGFQRALLVGGSNLSQVDVPDELKMVIDVPEGCDMPTGEAIAVRNQVAVLGKMRELFGPVERIFVVAAVDGGFSAGSVLAMLECAAVYLKECGYESGQRIGLFLGWPSAAELQERKAADEASFILSRLIELNKRKLFDPLVLGDRLNLISLFETLAAPVGSIEWEDGEEPEFDEESGAEWVEVEAVPQEEIEEVARQASTNIYGE